MQPLVLEPGQEPDDEPGRRSQLRGRPRFESEREQGRPRDDDDVSRAGLRHRLLRGERRTGRIAPPHADGTREQQR